MTFEIMLGGVALLYALEYSFFMLGISRSFRASRTVSASDSDRREVLPHVSVVVAARNEEENIGLCLEALLAQDYPPELIEIVAVNDESEDRTLEIIERMAAAAPGRIVPLSTVPERSGLHGKPRAIAQGVDVASGEIIMLTDADCRPSATWVSASRKYFRAGADVLGGFTLVDGETFFGRMQQLDWIHLQAIAAASMAFGSPVGVIGNNFGFRKQVYEEAGGYRGIPFSITEDFTLFLALVRNGNRVEYPCDPDALVRTRPCPDLQSVLRQKHRWGRGGIESTPHGYSIIVVAFLMLVAICVAPFVSPLAWGIVWGTKFLCDLAFLLPVMNRFGVERSIRFFLPFQFYFLAQALIVPLMLVNPNVHWKGRVFRTARPGVPSD